VIKVACYGSKHKVLVYAKYITKVTSCQTSPRAVHLIAQLGEPIFPESGGKITLIIFPNFTQFSIGKGQETMLKFLEIEKLAVYLRRLNYGILGSMVWR
jgi:hypothetical protein